MSSKKFLPLGLILLIAALMGSATAWAQNDPWTSVGAAGTVDESDTGLVVFGSIAPGVASMSATGTLNIRYNVVAVGGLFGGDNYALIARFLDNGADGQVVARLKQYGLNTGATTTLLTLDSNDFAGSAAFQVRTVTSACGTSLDFFNNAYFVDVDIIKTAAAGTPALGILKVSLSLC